jgi:hypothetical protein
MNHITDFFTSTASMTLHPPLNSTILFIVLSFVVPRSYVNFVSQAGPLASARNLPTVGNLKDILYYNESLFSYDTKPK